MKTKTIVALFTLLFAAGCFEIDQNIKIDKNLSGTADFHLGVDFEPMILIMAQFGHEMEGKKGPVTAAELAKAKADFKKNEKKSEDKPPSLADMQKDLPKGVKILDFNMKEKEFGLDSNFKFGFDRLTSLVGVKLPAKKAKEGEDAGPPDPTQKNVIDSPFEGLEVVEKGNTITIRTKPINPTEAVKEETKDAPKMDADTEKMMRDAFKKMHVTYRITAPFTVVSHNATRQEGDTLVWEYNLESFEAMQKAKTKPEDMGVRVTYKR